MVFVFSSSPAPAWSSRRSVWASGAPRASGTSGAPGASWTWNFYGTDDSVFMCASIMRVNEVAWSFPQSSWAWFRLRLTYWPWSRFDHFWFAHDNSRWGYHYWFGHVSWSWRDYFWFRRDYWSWRDHFRGRHDHWSWDNHLWCRHYNRSWWGSSWLVAFNWSRCRSHYGNRIKCRSASLRSVLFVRLWFRRDCVIRWFSTTVVIVLKNPVIVFSSDAWGPSEGVNLGSLPSAVVWRQWNAIIVEAGASLNVESVLIEPELREILCFTCCSTIDPLNREGWRT